MKHLWIINQYSSTTLFYHSYENIEMDPNLVSGLLTAFNSFSEVELSSQGVSAIEMAGMRWIYLRKTDESGLLLVAASDFELEAEIIRSRLEVVHSVFIDMYKITIEEVRENTFNLREFDPFHERLMSLEDEWNKEELLLGNAVLKDILGVFQQIFNRLHEIIQNEINPTTQEKIIQEIQQMSVNLKNTLVIQECPGLSEISYNRETGWSIMDVNHMMMDGELLLEALLMITRNIKLIMLKYISVEDLTYHLTKYVLPYILDELELIRKINMDKKLLNHFFVLD